MSHRFGVAHYEMTGLILAAGTFCILATAAHCSSLLTVIARVRRQRICAQPADIGVSILRPLCGIDNFSEATLRSTFHLDHRRYEILFCVADAADSIVPIARRLIETHPEIPARLLVGADRISSNPKLNNLVKGWHAASYPWIVMADSNVLMPADYLGRLLHTWQADTGVVSSPAIGCMPQNLWGELECAFLNTYQARWQCFADEIGLGFVQGKNMLFNKAFIEASGGIRALASELAEDAAATKLVRKRGLRARVVDKPFVQPLGRRTAAEVWQRQIRWARLRRDTFVLYFLPELLAGALPPFVGWSCRSPASGRCSSRSGTGSKPWLPVWPGGVFPGDPFSSGCSAMRSCPCSLSQPGSAKTLNGAAIR